MIMILDAHDYGRNKFHVISPPNVKKMSCSKFWLDVYSAAYIVAPSISVIIKMLDSYVERTPKC